MKQMHLLKLITSMVFEIDRDWGIQTLNNVMFNSVLASSPNSSLTEVFAEMKAASLQIDFFDKAYNYLGTNLEDIPANSRARVSLTGPMTVEDTLCSVGMVSVDKMMRQLYANKNIDGILYRTNSGGGQSSAASVGFNTIADKNKPVVAHGTMMGSACYGNILSCDEVIMESANNFVGSIGSMMTLSKSILEDDYYIHLYSKKSGNKNKDYREAKKGNFEPYIEMLTKNDEAFMKKVMDNRPLKGSAVYQEHTLSGALFTADEGKKRGLIDGIGSLNYALKRLNSHIINNS